MENIFLVLGYGVPKNIVKDSNYNLYLSLVFNSIYSECLGQKEGKPRIIFCGGKTDIFKPYRRDEAGEMIKLFKRFCGRDFVSASTKNWRLLRENKSLSTLENLFFSRQHLEKAGIKKALLTIFCEYSRYHKVKVLAKKVFGSKYKIKVKAIDFNMSATRYLSEQFISKKEKQDIRFALWSLSRPQRMKKHHQVFKERLTRFRKLGPKKHETAIINWWAEKIKELSVK